MTISTGTCSKCQGKLFPCPATNQAHLETMYTYCPVCDECTMCQYQMSPVKAKRKLVEINAVAPNIENYPHVEVWRSVDDGEMRAKLNGEEVSVEQAAEYLQTFWPMPYLYTPGPTEIHGEQDIKSIINAMKGLRSAQAVVVPYESRLEAMPFPGGYFELFRIMGQWSNQTFGDENHHGPNTPLLHIIKIICMDIFGCPESTWTNIQHLLATQAGMYESVAPKGTPRMASELANLEILLMDAVRRAGFTSTQHIRASHDKHVDNVNREWKPVEYSSGTLYEHVRPKAICPQPHCGRELESTKLGHFPYHVRQGEYKDTCGLSYKPVPADAWVAPHGSTREESDQPT